MKKALLLISLLFIASCTNISEEKMEKETNMTHYVTKECGTEPAFNNEYWDEKRPGIYVDVNGQQCDGLVSDVMNIEPLDKRLESFGARVFVVDGHDIDSLVNPAKLEPDGRPLVVLAKTDPCKVLNLLRSNAPKLHYLRFKSTSEKENYIRVLKKIKI